MRQRNRISSCAAWRETSLIFEQNGLKKSFAISSASADRSADPGPRRLRAGVRGLQRGQRAVRAEGRRPFRVQGQGGASQGDPLLARAEGLRKSHPGYYSAHFTGPYGLPKVFSRAPLRVHVS